MSKPLPRYRPDTDPAKLDRIIDDTPETTTTTKRTSHRSGEGDQQRMRAIPVIANGIPGTIPNTEGLSALIRKQRIATRFKARRLHRA